MPVTPGRHTTSAPGPGRILWQLGGKDSSFTEQAAPGQVLDSANEIFAWQHDPEALGNDTYTYFDNESSGVPLLPYSRAVTVKLNFQQRTATLVASDDQPEGLSAASQGNAQTTQEHNLFVGWGILPYFSEFSPSGALLFNAEFPAGVNTYRAYLLPWYASSRWGSSGRPERLTRLSRTGRPDAGDTRPEPTPSADGVASVRVVSGSMAGGTRFDSLLTRCTENSLSGPMPVETGWVGARTARQARRRQGCPGRTSIPIAPTG